MGRGEKIISNKNIYIIFIYIYLYLPQILKSRLIDKSNSDKKIFNNQWKKNNLNKKYLLYI